MKIREKLKDGNLEEYKFNITNAQNANCVIKQVYRDIYEDRSACDKCQKGQGGLIGCITLEGFGKSCANCEWNRGNTPCSFDDSIVSFLSVRPYILMFI